MTWEDRWLFPLMVGGVVALEGIPIAIAVPWIPGGSVPWAWVTSGIAVATAVLITYGVRTHGRASYYRGRADASRRYLMSAEPAICPECRQGKHRNCDGSAWDIEADTYTQCECELIGHRIDGDSRG